MTISSVSTNSNVAHLPQCNNNTLKILENQKMQLQEQIQNVNESKIDPKIKQEQVKELTEQITEIEAQIRQEQMKKMQPDIDEQEVKNNNYYKDDDAESEKSEGDINSIHFISAVVGYSHLKVMGKVKTELEGQLRTARNSEVAEGISKKIEKLKGDIQKKTEKINDDLKKATKDRAEIEKQEPENVNNKDAKDIQEYIKNENGNEQNPATINNGETSVVQENNKDKSTYDEKSIKKVKKRMSTKGRVVDIRV